MTTEQPEKPDLWEHCPYGKTIQKSLKRLKFSPSTAPPSEISWSAAISAEGGQGWSSGAKHVEAWPASVAFLADGRFEPSAGQLVHKSTEDDIQFIGTEEGTVIRGNLYRSFAWATNHQNYWLLPVHSERAANPSVYRVDHADMRADPQFMGSLLEFLREVKVHKGQAGTVTSSELKTVTDRVMSRETIILEAFVKEYYKAWEFDLLGTNTVSENTGLRKNLWVKKDSNFVLAGEVR